MARPTVAQVLAARIAEVGTRHVFGVPGESFTPFLDALRDRDDIEFVVARQEGGAAFMAEAYGSRSGTVGVAIGGRSVGAANLSIGIYTAQDNSTPTLFVVGDVERGARHRESFQGVDLESFLAPVSKRVIRIDSGQNAGLLIGRALTECRVGRPGPVTLVIPEDVFDLEVEDEPLRPLPAVHPPSASPQAVAEAAGAIGRSHRPLIVAGAGVLRSGAQSKLAEVAERLCVPVVAGWRRHDAVDNGSPAYAGHTRMGLEPRTRRLISEADLILAAGSRLNDITTQGYSLVSSETTIIQVDIQAEMIGKSHPVDVGVHSDVRSFLEALAAVEVPPVERRRAWFTDARSSLEEWFRAGDEASSVGDVSLAQVMRTLRRSTGPEVTFVNDAGNFAGWFHGFVDFPGPGTYIGASSGAMGYAVPAAVGAQLASPTSPVVSVAGDGGFMMTAQELSAAVERNLDITFIVVNNASYGSIRMHQEKRFPTRVIGSDLTNPDFVGLARAWGIPAERVTDTASFGEVAKRLVARGGPSLIEVVTAIDDISVGRSLQELRAHA